MKHLLTFLAGLLFSVGLVLSGMTQPSKVIGFLDFFGNWDPSLALVMGGAVMINLVMWQWWVPTHRPLYDSQFHLPKYKDIDRRLVFGSAIFGIGWGLGGFCPGPAITSLASGATEALTFTSSMAVGMMAFCLLQRRQAEALKLQTTTSS